MFFLLAPKWVKMRPTDAFYTVHPRSQARAPSSELGWLWKGFLDRRGKKRLLLFSPRLTCTRFSSFIFLELDFPERAPSKAD